MKYLTDRHEIAMAMNFHKYPVIRIDMETPKKGYKGLYYGDEVEVATPKPGYPDSRERGNLIFCDGKYQITSHGCCLSADFGYVDVMEDLMWAQAPQLHKGETVVVIEDYPIHRMCKVHMMRVPDHVSSFTTPCCTLEEVPNDFKVEGVMEL